ncbi:MAG: ThuA domain-containing protein [bacterium]|nr:ThuA domain-containing protein [bacterium]
MKKNVLYISAGLMHPSLKARRYLKKLLSSIEEVTLTTATGIESAKKLRQGNYDAVVLYLHRQDISDEALDALCDFVAQGGGLVGVHSATASFKSSNRFFDLLGGRFILHEAVIDFTVRQGEGKTGIFGPVGDFVVHDELYIHECKDDIDIHFYVREKEQEHPIVWTREYGNGRVCYVEPGHCASSIENEAMREILRKGVLWVSH